MVTPLEKVSRLSSRVMRILGCNPSPMTLQGTNTYLIGTGKERVLIDAGDPNVNEYLDVLTGVVNQNNVKLQRIMITHWHQDHVGGVNGIMKRFKLEYGQGTNGCLVQKFQDVKHDDRSLVDKFEYLKDGDEIEIEGATLKVIHTPGHSEDHLIIVLKEENAVFSGDCILGEGTTVFEDLYDYMKSLNIILELKPDVIYPGHGPVIQDPIPRISQYIEHRLQRERQIFDSLPSDKENALTVMQIVKKVYTETPSYLHVAAAGNVKHHLSKLIKEGKVATIEGPDLRYFRAD